MRNVLAPSRMARYLPWKRASQRATPFIAQPVSILCLLFSPSARLEDCAGA